MIKHFITIGNRKYFYTLKSSSKKTTFVECKDARIKQDFLNEDVVSFLNDLPNLILAEKEYKNQQSEMVRFRVSPEDKKQIEKRALKMGYNSVSSFLRDLGLGQV